MKKYASLVQYAQYICHIFHKYKYQQYFYLLLMVLRKSNTNNNTGINIGTVVYQYDIKLYYNRINVSEGIDSNKSNKSKKMHDMPLLVLFRFRL